MRRNLLPGQAFVLIFLFFNINVFSQTFVEQTGITLPALSNGSVAWGDYNNDNHLDILISGIGSDNIFSVKVLLNNGSNSFTEESSAFSPSIPVDLAYYRSKAQWSDLNNDGYIDIVITGQTNTGGNFLFVYKNEGNNSFTLKKHISYLTMEGSVSDCGDYDNDGDQDILYTTNSSSAIYQNQGNFVFTEQYSISLARIAPSSCKWGDFDNDGDLDVFTGSALHQNQGDNFFTRLDYPQFYNHCETIEWGDYNNDGFSDILITGNFPTIVYKNNGNNTFTEQPSITTYPVNLGAGKWGDLDNDGDLDIIISGDNIGTYISKIFINNGNNTFTEASSISIDGVKESAIDLGDYDNDGDLDILLTGNKGTSKITRIYRNETPTVNVIPSAPSELSSSMQGSDIVLKWKSVSSDNTSMKAISYNIQIGSSTGGIEVVSPNSSSSGLRRITNMGNSQYDTTFRIRNIKKGTYYWKVQAVDNSFKGSLFSSESTFNYTAEFQAFGLKASITGGKESTLTWSRGNGDNCIVFMKESNTGSALPVNNVSYTPSATFKTGTQIGATGWYCIYKGSGSAVIVTALSPGTEYSYQVFEFDGLPGSEVYNNQSLTGNPLVLKTGYFTEVKSALLDPVNIQNWQEQTPTASWFDFDNDNDLDLLLVGSNASKIYRNDGNDIFTLMPVTLNIGFSAACSDYDNDGFIDIIISGSPTRIYRNNGDGTFTEKPGITFPDITLGSLAWGDYDNNGFPDIVITGITSTGRICKIFKNNGDGTFSEQNLITLVGVAVSSSEWGDYDNDGFIDLLISGMTNSGTFITKVYHNTGDNNFIEQTDIILPGALDIAYWTDYDSDGDLDIQITDNQSRSGAIFRNDRNNLFREQTDILFPYVRYGSASWGDYDNDGDYDLLFTGSTGALITRILKNNGDNTFTEDLTSTITGVGYSAGSWGDYDNDGDLDIVLTGNSSDGSISKIYRNDFTNSNIKPAAPDELNSSVIKSDVALKWKRVRSDNTPYKSISYNIKVGTATGGIDIVSPNSSDAGFRKMAGIGNCNLDSVYILKRLKFGTYYWSVQAIDNGLAGGPFSAEGTFTIVPVQAGNLSAKIINNNSLQLKWERGNGDRCVVFCRESSTGSAIPVNNTGYIADSEFGYGAQIGSSGWFCIYNGRADSVNVSGLVYQKEYSFHVIEYSGTFGSEQYFTEISDGNPGVFSTSLFAEQTGITFVYDFKNSVAAWGDYDNDGLLDILIPEFYYKIYHNNGNNTFSEQTGISLPLISNGAAAWGDYDNDSDLDIIISGATNGDYADPVTRIYRNNGNNTFTEQSSISLTGVLYSSVAWGDYNNDGFIDILLTGATGIDPNFNPVSKIYKNNGNGSFTEQSQIYLTGIFRGSADWGDYDNDGDLDIILTGAIDYQYNYKAFTKVYKNNGNNTFSAQTQIQLHSYSTSSWGDFDNDSDLDFLVTSFGSMSLYKNLGNNQFDLFYTFYLGAYQSACYGAWGDYNNDGYIDIILSNPGLDTKIFKNIKGKTFNQQDDEALKSIGYHFVGWGDYDNDSDLDFILANGSRATSVFKNNSIMKSGLFKTNNPPDSPKGSLSTKSPIGVTLHWDPVNTDETPAKAMTYNVKTGTSKVLSDICPSNSLSNGYRNIVSMGNTQLDTTFLFKNLASGKYYWSVQAVDQGFKGGKWSAVDSFEVKNVQTFYTADTVCLGYSTHFTDQSVSADGIKSWKWDFRDGSYSESQNPAHTFESSGSFLVKLVITSNGGVKDSLEKYIIIKPRPSTGFSSAITCQGLPVTITNTTNENGLTITAWYWDFDDGQTSTIFQPPPHGYLNAGNYNVKLKANASNGCADSTVKAVIVANYPVASISASGLLSFCNGDSVALSVPYNTNFTYDWMIDGISQTGADSSRFAAKLSGDYSVKVVNSVGNCLTTSSKVSVTSLIAPSAPLISVKGSLAFCQGDSAILSASSTSGFDYSWKLNGGSVGSNSNEYTAQSQGRYTLSVTNNNNCSVLASNYIDIVVNPLPTVSSVTPNSDPTFCEGGSVTLSVVLNSNHSYSWYNESGPLNVLTNSYTASASGKYYLNVANSSGCSTKTAPYTVTVKPMPSKPVITADGYADGQCPPTINKVKLSTQGVSGYSYQWLKNGVIFQNKTLPYIEDNLPQSEYIAPGDYSLEATISGCKSVSDNYNISYAAAPEEPTLLVKGPVVWYMATSKNSYKQYRWYYNDELIQGATKYIYVANKKLGTYRVEVADDICFTKSDPVTIPTAKSGFTDFNIPSEYLISDKQDLSESIKIFPNPTPGLFTIEMDNDYFGEINISIATQTGKEILKIKLQKITEQYSTEIDLGGQAKGVYLINMLNENHLVTKKLIIE
jgi:PKD repeat protein